MQRERPLVTVADLEAMGDAAERFELFEGKLVPSPSHGMRDAGVVSDLNLDLAVYIRNERLGVSFGPNTGFILGLNPDSVLGPDFAFVAKERLAAHEDVPLGFMPLAPDLAVEVRSPFDSESILLRKTAIYLAAGVRAVWLVRPEQRTVTVFTPDAPERILGMGEALDGGDIVPGFSLPLAEIFRQA